MSNGILRLRLERDDSLRERFVVLKPVELPDGTAARRGRLDDHFHDRRRQTDDVVDDGREPASSSATASPGHPLRLGTPPFPGEQLQDVRVAVLADAIALTTLPAYRGWLSP